MRPRHADWLYVVHTAAPAQAMSYLHPSAQHLTMPLLHHTYSSPQADGAACPSCYYLHIWRMPAPSSQYSPTGTYVEAGSWEGQIECKAFVQDGPHSSFKLLGVEVTPLAPEIVSDSHLSGDAPAAALYEYYGFFCGHYWLVWGLIRSSLSLFTLYETAFQTPGSPLRAGERRSWPRGPDPRH